MKRARWRRRPGNRRRNLPSEPYTVQYLAERDGNRCGICGRKVNLNLKHPHPRMASVDHIIPTSTRYGGDDTRTNVQLAHLQCNRDKNTRALPTDQLRLIG